MGEDSLAAVKGTYRKSAQHLAEASPSALSHWYNEGTPIWNRYQGGSNLMESSKIILLMPHT